MSTDAVMSKLETLEEKLDTVQDEVNSLKAGNQPDSYYKIKKDGQPTETTRKLLREVKKGGKLDGLRTSQVRAILQENDFDYTQDGTRNVMERLGREFEAMEYVSRRGAKGSELQWHPDRLQ